MTPEQKARVLIDKKLVQAGWIVQDMKQLNLFAGLGVAVREFPTSTGPVDYLIRINQFDCINAEYLAYYMNSFTAKQYGNKVKTDGVNQSNINGKKLCSYPFPLCSQEEQAQVVYELESRLSVCDSIEKTVDIALQQAEAMRQSILKKAFEGGF